MDLTQWTISSCKCSHFFFFTFLLSSFLTPDIWVRLLFFILNFPSHVITLQLNCHLKSPYLSALCCALFGSPTALLEVILAGRDCLVAGDSCSSDETCSPRLRTLRQCVAGNGSMKLGPGARSQCANAVSALLSSPLHGCQCKRGMKKEKNCLSIYWSLHQSIIHGQWLLDRSLYF